ncbi:MAG: N-acetylmuramoyl-L-alanine amidase [Clostridiaceae bacterium]|nr:N-acetylmuramoyl-L-alanine amidase [Clostridiaceae bacterium]
MIKHSQKEMRKKLRRQATIIVSLGLIVVVVLIILAGMLIFRFVSDRVSSAQHNNFETTMAYSESSGQTNNPSLSNPSSDSEQTTVPVESSTISSSSVESSAPDPTDVTDGVLPTELQLPTIPSDIDGPDLTGYLVVIDPGHQMYPDSEQEPLSPTMSGSKDRVSSGTSGVSTKRPEYEVNLEIALLLKVYLEELGCEVYLTRTENDVNISNIERAEFALSYMPDAYLRLHCNGNMDSSVRGISVFVADFGKHKSNLCVWADALGQSISLATGSPYIGCNASSRYSGLNWATDIPSFLLEMGFMTNQQEDELLSDYSYQLKICSGIADFVSTMPKNTSR